MAPPRTVASLCLPLRGRREVDEVLVKCKDNRIEQYGGGRDHDYHEAEDQRILSVILFIVLSSTL